MPSRISAGLAGCPSGSGASSGGALSGCGGCFSTGQSSTIACSVLAKFSVASILSSGGWMLFAMCAPMAETGRTRVTIGTSVPIFVILLFCRVSCRNVSTTFLSSRSYALPSSSWLRIRPPGWQVAPSSPSMYFAACRSTDRCLATSVISASLRAAWMSMFRSSWIRSLSVMSCTCRCRSLEDVWV